MGLLSFLVFSPLIGFIVFCFIPKKEQTFIRNSAVVLHALPLLASVLVLFQFLDHASLAEKINWITFEIGEKVLGLHFELNVDGFSLVLILLTTLIGFLAVITSTWHINKDSRLFYQLMFLLQMGILGVFAADNLFLFFIFFEITLVPMFFLISKWGGTDREEAAFRYVIYNGLGSMILLIGIAAIFVLAGSTNYAEVQQYFAENGSPTLQLGLAFAFLLAFGIKLPIFPLHSWMVKVHVHAPPAVVMIHAGVLLKIGAYGLIKFGVGFFPDAFDSLAILIAVLGLFNLLYGAYLAFVQEDLRSVFAYSSISHMGIVLLGVSALNTAGIQGAIFQSVSHGLIAAMLFFLVGSLLARTNTTLLKKLSGLARLTPLLAGFFLAAALANLGLPGMSGFVSEFTVFLGIFKEMPILAAIGTLGIIMTVVYLLRAIINMTYGTYKSTYGEVQDLKASEVVPAVVLLICIIGIGVYPNAIGHMLQLTIETILGIGG